MIKLIRPRGPNLVFKRPSRLQLRYHFWLEPLPLFCWISHNKSLSASRRNSASCSTVFFQTAVLRLSSMEYHLPPSIPTLEFLRDRLSPLRSFLYISTTSYACPPIRYIVTQMTSPYITPLHPIRIV